MSELAKLHDEEDIPQAQLITKEAVQGEVKPTQIWAPPSMEHKRKAEAQRLREAEALALQKQVKIKAQAIEGELAKIRQARYEEGYKSGFAKGEAEGYAAGQAQASQEAQAVLEDKLAQFSKLLEGLENPLKALEAEFWQILAQMMTRISQQVTLQTLYHKPEIYHQLLEKLIAHLPEDKAGSLKIILHPQDYQLLQPLVTQQNEPWQLIADETLQPGEIRLENQLSEIYYDLQGRIDELVADFIHSLNNPAV